jgi:Putative zincin peptidase
MSLLLVDWCHPQQRRQQQAAIDAGHIRKVDELALLEEEQLRPLAGLSLVMLVCGGIFFGVLNLVAYHWHYQHWLGPLSLGGILLWLVINAIGYILILPIHEAIHGLCFALWGGKPHFGARLPLALYCGARQQLFRRHHYLVVGLAPLILITFAGIVMTLLFPGIASYLLLAFVGNFAGAAGDVLVARRLMHLSELALVEDTELGYIAWEIVRQPD